MRNRDYITGTPADGEAVLAKTLFPSDSVAEAMQIPRGDKKRKRQTKIEMGPEERFKVAQRLIDQIHGQALRKPSTLANDVGYIRKFKAHIESIRALSKQGIAPNIQREYEARINDLEEKFSNAAAVAYKRHVISFVNKTIFSAAEGNIGTVDLSAQHMLEVWRAIRPERLTTLRREISRNLPISSL